MLKKSLITAAALFASPTYGHDIGIKSSVALDVIEQAKDIYIWTVLDAVLEIRLPDFVAKNGNYAKDNSVWVD